jgi:hypothetical protein
MNFSQSIANKERFYLWHLTEESGICSSIRKCPCCEFIRPLLTWPVSMLIYCVVCELIKRFSSITINIYIYTYIIYICIYIYNYCLLLWSYIQCLISYNFIVLWLYFSYEVITSLRPGSTTIIPQPSSMDFLQGWAWCSVVRCINVTYIKWRLSKHRTMPRNRHIGHLEAQMYFILSHGFFFEENF